MKRRFFGLLAAVCILIGLSGCGSAGEVIDYNLVFVNDSDAAIIEVVVDFTDQTSGTRNANSSPLKRGETFGFESGGYPATVAVYDRTIDSMEMEPGELARIVISEAPPEGERWYITARDGANGLVLAADTVWPEGV